MQDAGPADGGGHAVDEEGVGGGWGEGGDMMCRM